MFQFTDNLISTLSIFTLLANGAIVVLLALYLYTRLWSKKTKEAERIIKLIRNNAVTLSLAVATLSVIGSLMFSEFSQFEPCLLCWYQRIFMYPLVIIFAMSLIKKDRGLVYSYSIPLTAIGFAIAVYHYIIQMISTLSGDISSSLVPCSTGAGGHACTSFFFITYGYITIPLMSVTAFGLILLFLLIGRKINK